METSWGTENLVKRDSIMKAGRLEVAIRSRPLTSRIGEGTRTALKSKKSRVRKMVNCTSQVGVWDGTR